MKKITIWVLASMTVFVLSANTSKAQEIISPLEAEVLAPVVDICPNLEEIQEVIPGGMIVNDASECVVETIPEEKKDEEVVNNDIVVDAPQTLEDTLSSSEEIKNIFVQIPQEEVLEMGTCGVVTNYRYGVGGENTNQNTFDWVWNNDSTSGDFVDHKWVQVFGTEESRLVWDMTNATNEAYLVPSIDHGPAPEEAHEATLYGSNSPTGPWVAGTETTIYTDGPSNWISDDDTALWAFPESFRYISALAGGTLLNDGDAEIDAVCAPVVPPVETFSCEYTEGINFSAKATNWSENSTINFFNPSLGTLSSIDITHSFHSVVNQQIENKDITPIVISSYLNGTNVFSFAGHTSTLSFSSTAGPVTLDAYDGILDFAGVSGFTLGATNYDQTDSVITITDPTELATFINNIPGGIPATETSSGTSGVYWLQNGVMVYQPSNITSAHVDVTYHYISESPCLPPPPSFVCSDNSDNDEDGLIDSLDPGCHSDNNANNPDSYVPTDTDETDDETPTDVCPNIDGIQTTVPNNKHINNSGNCVKSGGGGSSGGSRINTPAGEVLGAETSCGIYLDKFLQKGRRNDPEAVKKLQIFLNLQEGANLEVDGIFGSLTDQYVRIFQYKHMDKVLNPWGLLGATGIVYLTTVTEINNIMCPPLDLPIPNPLTPTIMNPSFPASI